MIEASRQFLTDVRSARTIQDLEALLSVTLGAWRADTFACVMVQGADPHGFPLFGSSLPADDLSSLLGLLPSLSPAGALVPLSDVAAACQTQSAGALYEGRNGLAACLVIDDAERAIVVVSGQDMNTEAAVRPLLHMIILEAHRAARKLRASRLSGGGTA